MQRYGGTFKDEVASVCISVAETKTDHNFCACCVINTILILLRTQ